MAFRNRGIVVPFQVLGLLISVFGTLAAFPTVAGTRARFPSANLTAYPPPADIECGPPGFPGNTLDPISASLNVLMGMTDLSLMLYHRHISSLIVQYPGYEQTKLSIGPLPPLQTMEVRYYFWGLFLTLESQLVSARIQMTIFECVPQRRPFDGVLKVSYMYGQQPGSQRNESTVALSEPAKVGRRAFMVPRDSSQSSSRATVSLADFNITDPENQPLRMDIRYDGVAVNRFVAIHVFASVLTLFPSTPNEQHAVRFEYPTSPGWRVTMCKFRSRRRLEFPYWQVGHTKRMVELLALHMARNNRWESVSFFGYIGNVPVVQGSLMYWSIDAISGQDSRC